MKKLILALIVLFSMSLFGQSIQQQLIVTQTLPGANGFRVAVQVQGTDLPVANTVLSATIDIAYDNTKLTYNGTSFAGVTTANGYNSSATNNTTFIRLIITGGAVAPGDPFADPIVPDVLGYDMTASYATWATLRFTILDPLASTDLTIMTGSNAISLFSTHSNSDNSGASLTPSPTRDAPINIINAPLPVELTSFTASVNRLNAELNWSTATEKNNYGFEVERRQVDAAEWVKVGFVAGAGTKASPSKYSYVDAGVAPGRYAYRIKQIDIDGAFKYGSSTEVEIGLVAKTLSLSDAYPNPFNPTTLIEFTLPNDGRATLKVYNTIGQEVANLFDGQASAGRIIQARFDARSLSTGLYFARLQFGGKSLLKKMLFVK